MIVQLSEDPQNQDIIVKEKHSLDEIDGVIIDYYFISKK
jgi:hypothetical protein